MQENQKYEKRACQNTVAKETLNCLGQDKPSLVAFDSISNKVIYAQSQRGHFLPSPPPPPPPTPGRIGLTHGCGCSREFKKCAKTVIIDRPY